MITADCSEETSASLTSWRYLSRRTLGVLRVLAVHSPEKVASINVHGRNDDHGRGDGAMRGRGDAGTRGVTRAEQTHSVSPVHPVNTK